MPTLRCDWFRTVLAAVASLSCLMLVAADGVAPNAAVEPPKEVVPPQPPAPPAPRTRIVHPQVSRLPLAREYRSRLLSDAATSEAARKIDAALAGRVDDWQFNETPLRDAMAQVKGTLRIPLVLDTRALEDAGIDIETPITFDTQGISARAALRRILADYDLTWMIRDEALVITTRERASDKLSMRLYAVPWGYAETVPVDFQSLIDLIQNAIGGPAAWADGGGPGSIRPWDGATDPVLVVAQTEEVHDEIEAMLRGLHQRALAEFGGPDDIPASKTPTVRVHYVADAEIREDLAMKLVALCNESLPYGADPQAKVTAVGECLAVQSVSPEFHALVGRLIRSVAGVKVGEGPHPMGVGTSGGGMSGGMF
jgi:hypothetical protein